MKNIAGIYLIRHLKTLDVYVGSSKNIKKRIRAHRVSLNKNKHRNPHLQKAWNESDHSLFDFSIQELCEEDTLLDRESYWIKFYDSLNPEKGYNYSIPDNSRVPRKREEVVKKPLCKYICINKNTKERNVLNRKEINELLDINNNAISELSAYWRGNLKSGKSNKGWMIINQIDFNEDFNYLNYDKIIHGRLPSKKRQSLAKISEIIPMHERNIFRRPILMKNISTGEELTFNSIASAISTLNLVSSKVGKCLQREFGKNSHRGFHFKYI